MGEGEDGHLLKQTPQPGGDSHPYLQGKHLRDLDVDSFMEKTLSFYVLLPYVAKNRS